MRVKFKHFRQYTTDGKISNLGGRTLAAVIDDRGCVVRYATAACHPSDNFNKRMGRIKSEGRLKSESQSTLCGAFGVAYTFDQLVDAWG